MRTGKANESEPSDDASRDTSLMSKPRKRVASGRAWGRPVVLPRRHPAYRRREPGSGASVERVKLHPDTARVAIAVEVDG